LCDVLVVVLSSYVTEFFVNKAIHSYSTRQRHDLHNTYMKKSFGKKTVQHEPSVCTSVCL